MGEVGVLYPDARVELLDGVVLDMARQTPYHAGVTRRLLHLFTVASKNRWIASPRNPIHLDSYSEPRPDLALVRPASDFYYHQHPKPDDTFLIIEVADTSLEFDQQVKLPAYGRAGIPEVWIVNLNDLTIEVHREPHFTGYGANTVLREGDTAAPLAFPDAVVDVGELLRR